ncbi:MAG: 30S ribosomal protein S20, partial [Fidelibacterota bacterium]
NRHYKSLMKTCIKKVKKAEDFESAQKYFQEAVSIIDKVAAKKIIHRNRAASMKSKLAKYVNGLSSN